MKLFYIRHGQSTNNLLWALKGEEESRVEDPLLTDVGKEQARKLAAFVRDQIIGKECKFNGYIPRITIYCSLMIRAVETGLQISQALELPLFAYPDVHEIGGIYLADETTGEKVGLAGKSKSYFLKNYPTLFLSSNMSDAGWWGKLSEKRSDAYNRALRVKKVLFDLHPDEDEIVILVSHAGFYNAFLKASLDLGMDYPLWFELNNAAISLMKSKQGILEICYLNRFEHIPHQMRT